MINNAFVKVALVLLWIVGLVTSTGQIVGKYELQSNPEDPAYNEYLIALGVSEPFRLVMTKLQINIEIEKAAGDGYRYKIKTPYISKEVTFEFGKELNETYVDQRPYSSIYVRDGEAIKQTLNFYDGNVGTSEYKFHPGGITIVQAAQNKTVIREYRRVP